VNKKNNWEETARVFYLYKYPSNLDLVIPPVHWTYEDGTDRVFQTMAHKIQSPGNHPNERIQHSQYGKSLKSGITMLLSDVKNSNVCYKADMMQDANFWPKYNKLKICYEPLLHSSISVLNNFIKTLSVLWNHIYLNIIQEFFYQSVIWKMGDGLTIVHTYKHVLDG